MSSFSYLTLHALGWLCFANAVGFFLGLMLLAPALNEVMAPITYGRLIPVHLNGQLYGWCFLPLIGLLFKFFDTQSFAPARYLRSVDAWTVALAFGCMSWMAGRSGGKLFMEWSEVARVVLPAAMLFLAGALLMSLLHKVRQSGRFRRCHVLPSLLWMVLLPVPFIMFWAASPTLFPPINPDSGGATGGDLLVSSLGAVTILWMCPYLLQVPCRRHGKRLAFFILLQGAHYLAFALMDHGDQSNYRPAEIVGLLSLLIWVPLLIVHFRGFSWPRAARPWLWALALWAIFLVVSANVMFLPGFLDQWKFTHFIVGHTHAAMAGMLSAFNILVLITLEPESSWSDVLGDQTLFWLWNLSTLLMVFTLKGLGVMEGMMPGALFTASAKGNAFLGVRLLSGVILFAVSTCWLRSGFLAQQPAFERREHV